MTIRTKPEFIAQRHMPGDRMNAATWIDMRDEPFTTVREAVKFIDVVRDSGSQGVIKSARIVGVVGEWEFD